MSLDILRESLPDAQRKHLAADAPLPARMMAAKGLAPLAPREMVIVLCGLSLEDDEKVATAARESLASLPEKVVAPALASELPVPALDRLARSFQNRDALLEPVALNRQTPDAALAAIASEVSSAIGEILISNQERCLRSKALVDGLRRNPRIIRSSKDRLFDFMVRSGVIHDDMPEFAEAFSRLSSSEVVEMSESVSLPPEVMALTHDGSVGAMLDGVRPEIDSMEELENLDLEAEQVSEGDEADAELAADSKNVSMLQLINGLNTAQKIALAMKGNKEARSILIRDTNKMVASAAIRSPRITEQEVKKAAQSRQVSDDVIRFISNSRELLRSYPVKVALAQNPKTPQPTAMKLLTLLRQPELRSISKSKNVPSAVSAQAKRILNRKRGAGR